MRLVLLALAGLLVCCSTDPGDASVSGAPPGSDAATEGDSGSAEGDGGSSGDALPPASQPSPEVLFGSAIERIVVEVDYAPGAAPYTGSAGQLGDVWSIARDNLDAVFDGAKTLDLPSTLAQMEQLDDVTGTEFRVEDIVDIARRHRGQLSSGSAASFYVLFLDGKFVGADGVVSAQTLGVSVGNSGIVAMFKPVIAAAKGSKGTTTTTTRFVEQSTLVHELGHAVGLVENGVPATTPHHDASHAAHCTSTSCVMYWANEGASAAADFVRTYVETGNRLLFGPECLDDLRAIDARTP